MTADAVLNLLFPSRCPLCGTASDRHAANPVCRPCWNTIRRYEGPACFVCGIPLPSSHASRCARCLACAPDYSRVYFFGIYEGALRKAIHLLKYQGIRRMSKPLYGLLNLIPLPGVDAVVPVPVHKSRLKQREYNHAALLAYHVAKKKGIPILLDILHKKTETPPQAGLDARLREKNVRGSIVALHPATNMHVLLIDDVVTTGATVNECASALIGAGASEVSVLALARSVKNSDHIHENTSNHL